MENKSRNQQSRLAEVIDLLVVEIQNFGSKRRLGEEDIPKLTASVAKLITDSVAITKGRKQKRWASIHKMAGHYTASQYHNAEITYRIHVERAYQTLIELGYLAELKGGLYTKANRYLTRYEATDKMVSLFSERERAALHTDAPKSDNPELIRLHLKDQDNQKYLARYDVTEDIARMRDQMAFINSVLATSKFDLEITRDELEELEDQMHERGKERNEGDGRLRLQDTVLYRVFNDRDFKTGGRLYGGWWQTIPSRFRNRIRINGKRTVELDFGSLHPTMLYAKLGLGVPTDPYDVSIYPRSFGDGRTQSDYRTLVKRCFNAMLNANHRLVHAPQDTNLRVWGLKWKQMVDAILEKHSPIANQFFMGRGLALQFEDSEIAINVMEGFAKKYGMVPLLPIHDSFICHHAYEKDVRQAMKQEFTKRFNMRVKVKVTSWEDDPSHMANKSGGLSVFDDDIQDLAKAFGW